jgi:Tat protein secretion system quality control protein TatD with DNase activity
VPETGLNLFSHPLCDDATKVVSKAVGAGVTQMVLITTNAKNSAWSVDECAKRERSLYTMVGVHPYKAAASPLEEITKIKALAASKFCVAIGTYRATRATVPRVRCADELCWRYR